jgi:hypothetical protein
MRRIKTFESFGYTLEEYTLQVSDFLKPYNIFPSQISFLLDQYAAEIEEWYSEGKYAKELVNKIVKELGLGTGGMMQISLKGGNKWQNIYYK